MNRFQNVGTTNAGVVKFTGAAPAMGMGGVPTMDAAGIGKAGHHDPQAADVRHLSP